MPYYNAGVQVEKNAVYFKLQSKVGIIVMWNGDDAVMVKAHNYALYQHTVGRTALTKPVTDEVNDIHQ